MGRFLMAEPPLDVFFIYWSVIDVSRFEYQTFEIVTLTSGLFTQNGVEFTYVYSAKNNNNHPKSIYLKKVA